MKKTYKVGETLDVKIEKIVPRGYGLAFAENLTVFVPLGAPGDVLRVKIHQTKNKTAFAEIVEILTPSPVRIEAPCIYFGRCGGCDFQQLGYKDQLAAKVSIIEDALKRIGKIALEAPIRMIPSPQPFGYRGRAQWHVDARRRKIGYFQRNSHKVVDVVHCPILTDEMQKTLTGLRRDMDWNASLSEKFEIEAAGAGGRASVYSTEILEPTEELSFEAAGERFFYSAKNFFQGNPFLIEKLIELAVGGAGGRKALDLYCGVGLFTLPLARKFERVAGVEANREAVDFAERAAEAARLENAEFAAEPVDEFLAEQLSEGRLTDIDFILLDPPRAGAEKRTVENIIRIGPPEISYVSCDPSVLARDLRRLLDAGYRIRSVTAVDLFPQTHHVETVVRLEKN